jgi:hypothetical protein
MDFHPTQERWAYVRDDIGYIHKIDLYSLQTRAQGTGRA